MEMNDEIEAMDIEDDLFEFTLAEIVEMENLFKKMREKSFSQEVCQELATKFSCSPHRSEKSPIEWEQVQSWFQDKQINMAAKVVPSSPLQRIASSKSAILKTRPKGLSCYAQIDNLELKTSCKSVPVPTISTSEAALELPNLIFEARSAKDYAWFDVAYFLNYKVLSSGELFVRVRFAGFGKEEDEWVSVRRAVRERSIPLEHSECNLIDLGDLVLCYRETEDHALYSDAHVKKIERKMHDTNRCTCVFLVSYDHDNFEENVGIDKLCCRPTQSSSKGTMVVSKLV